MAREPVDARVLRRFVEPVGQDAWSVRGELGDGRFAV
jgi:hypothetical protein